MLKLNAEKWIERGLAGQITNLASCKPFFGKTGSSTAEPLPIFGITYNVFLGDPVWEVNAGIVEPGVIIGTQPGSNENPDESPSLAMACFLGNKVKIVLTEGGTVEAVVIASSLVLPGCVIIDVAERHRLKLHSSSPCWIISRGAGLCLPEFPQVHIFGIDPECLNKLELQQVGRNHIIVPVTCFIPADYFIPLITEKPGLRPLCYFNTVDKKERDKLGLHQLKFGDLIAISDLDYTSGFKLKKGAISIGIITMAPIYQWDVGFGLNIILSSSEGRIVPAHNPKANLGQFLSLGRYRKML
ncbi:MAG: DUF4438 domain-containing protein [Candidatus Sumerlaeia bacterium]|nr:DUF4438 domain-containing protein [Candidatus Sumerlaeia bacterium]